MTIWRGAGGGGNITTDTELTAITSLSAAATASAASATTSAASATASATAAATSASSMSTSVSASAASASAAATSASNAATSASNAAASAASIDPTTLVKLSGAQTIADVKTFTSTIVGAVNGNAGSATTLSGGADRTKLDAITGTNTGDQTNITGNATTVTTNANLTGGVTSLGNTATVVTNANLTGAITSIGNAASLGSFTSAALAGALTDETGSGANVFATSPTLVTPLLGTPTSGNLANCAFPTLNQNTTGTAANVTGIVALANGGTASSTAAGAKTILGFTTPADVLTQFNASGSAPVYACRAWVNFNGTGTVAIRASGNVSSITDNAVGQYTLNFTTALSDASYSIVSMSADGSAGTVCFIDENFAVPTTAAVSIRTTGNAATSNIDTAFVCVSIFR